MRNILLIIVRFVLVLILSCSICLLGIIYCILNCRKTRRASALGRLFGCMAPIFGIQIEIRNSLDRKFSQSCIYIANHQNNYDMVTVSYVVPSNTITVGKKSLLWIPLFGLLYWLSGNILINRSCSIQEYRVFLIKIIESIMIRKTSVWIFPEGTRSYGKGLLPFKTGAFYAAIYAKVPIIPICVSNLSKDRIHLDRWSNGLVIIEIMPPIETKQFDLTQVRILAAYCHKVMQLKLYALNKEVKEREN